MARKGQTGQAIYKPDFARLAYRHCLLGAIDKELGELFDVTAHTIKRWMVKYPEFYKKVIAGRNDADANVAERLYKRALGYEHKEDKIFQYQGEEVIVPTIKHYPPDTNAAIYWLKTRQRVKWREQQDININMEETPRTTKELITGIEDMNEEIKRLEAQL